MPNENLLEEMIVVETDIESGKVHVDLKSYDIVMEDDFLVSIEWIEDLGIGELLFSAGFFGSNLYARATSQGTWTQMGVAAFGMNVEVVYWTNFSGLALGNFVVTDSFLTAAFESINFCISLL